MKKNLTFLLCLCLTIGSTVAQNEPPLKPQVFKNVYFDISPPLRDMAKLPQKHADNSWKDGVVKNILYPFGFPKEEPMSTADHTIQNYQGTSSTDSLLLSFDGVSNVDNLLPPDTDGDVGPNHYFQVVNLHYSIFDKAGNRLIGPLANSSVFTGMSHNSNDGDAVVLYDEVEDRWIFTQFSLPTYPNGPFWEMVAISQTGDPTGSWYRYQFQFSDMPDYPKLGVWGDGIYMTTNRFSSGTSSFMGTGAACFEKAAMYAGNPTAQMVYFTLPSSNEAYAVLPSDCDGAYPPAGTPNFFAWIKSNHIRMYAFAVDWTTPTNSTYTLLCTIPVSSYNGTVSGIPQKGTSVQLDAISGRLMFRLPFRKFNDHWAMVANATVNVSGHAGIRWWELRNDASAPANWSIYQESTYSPDNNSRWMGSIAIDTLNNIALGYSLSSSTIYPSVCYTGRQVTDPLSTFSIAEKIIVSGGGYQSFNSGRSRWGDYSSMNADPSAAGKFWYTQEYYATSSSVGWKTRIGAFIFGNALIATASALPSLICGNDSSHLDVSVTGGSGTYTYSWTSNPPGYTSSLKDPWVHPALTTAYAITVSDGTNTRIDSVHVNVQAPATSNAGHDTTYCNYVPVFTVHGSGTGYDQSLWSSLGDGYFDDPTALSTQYHPMAQDKENGVKLILMVHAMLPCHGLANDTVTVLFDPCTGVNDQLTRNLNITVQPNPSSGIFDLTIDHLGNQSADVVVTDLQGHQVFHQVYQANGNQVNDHLNLSSLPKGSYIIKVKTETRNQIEKIIIQ